MWYLEMIESSLLAVPWALVAVMVVIGAIYALAIASWITMVVWVDVLGHDIEDLNLELAGAWDPDDVEEVADGRAA